MMSRKVAFHTLGCKVNYFESEGVWEKFSAAGYVRVNFTDVADVYVINTCSVTNGGDKKSRKFIRRAVRQNPDAVICVMGCFSQMQPDEVTSIEGVDIVLGTSGRDQLVALVEKFLKSRLPINIVSDITKEREFESLPVSKFENRKRGILKIQDGCNNFCTFCIIPWARGRVRSETPDVVISQAKELVANGHVEIVLTGIHTGAYGEDFEDYSFADLLAQLVKIDGLVRLRISSIEMAELTDDLLAQLASSDKIARHLHIPLQSGSDMILAVMNRKYNLAEFEANVDRIRKVLPDISLTTDIIVGFPGESASMFTETLEAVKRIGFSELHVFPYSVRSGTLAAKMSDQIPEIVKTMRVSEMIAVNEQLGNIYASQFVGDVFDVIVEKIEDDYGFGHGSNYLYLKFPIDADFAESIVRVKMVKANYPLCEGLIIKNARVIEESR